ncbi:MAG: DnaJ domain-containing protein, partial [Chthonomonadales bacterium]
MATNGPTYYEVLGISPVASPDEIKKRYRELARVHHPDVAKAPNAAETFKKINEANGVLSDPVRRSLYDSELALKSHRQAPSNPFETPASHFKPGPSSAAPSSANKSNQQRRAPDNDFKKVVLEAQQAYSKMRYREAEQLAREALRMYRRDPAVYELLGDIEVKRSRIDEAVAYYSYALQLDRMRPGL